MLRGFLGEEKNLVHRAFPGPWLFHFPTLILNVSWEKLQKRKIAAKEPHPALMVSKEGLEEQKAFFIAKEGNERAISAPYLVGKNACGEKKPRRNSPHRQTRKAGRDPIFAAQLTFRFEMPSRLRMVLIMEMESFSDMTRMSLKMTLVPSPVSSCRRWKKVSMSPRMSAHCPRWALSPRYFLRMSQQVGMKRLREATSWKTWLLIVWWTAVSMASETAGPSSRQWKRVSNLELFVRFRMEIE